jgi:glutathione S-transferase
MLAPPELKRIHSLGKAPVIEDEGVTVAETGAIIEYLIAKANGRFGIPAGSEEALLYRYFLHYAEGSLMPPLLVKLVLARIPLFGKIGERKFQPMIDVHLDFVEGELARRPWFAGAEISAADVMMSFPLEAAATRANARPGRRSLAAWLDRIHARPAYQAALDAGGPYKFA